MWTTPQHLAIYIKFFHNKLRKQNLYGADFLYSPMLKQQGSFHKLLSLEVHDFLKYHCML